MNETWRKRMIFGLLVVTLIWGYFALFGRPDKTASVIPTAELPTGYAVAQGTVSRVNISDSLLTAYRLAAWGHDPFNRNPLSTAADLPADTPALHLLGILYRQTGAQALINGRIASEGDIIDGYRIMSINRENVVMQSGGRTVVLRVGKEAS